jgi:hypothetical protein
MRVLLPPAEWLAGPGRLAAHEVVSYVVTAAVWAPSVHNSQPWRFGACGQEISLHADAGRQLMVAAPLGREMIIGCGAALFNARLALRSLGYVPEARVARDPDQPSLVAWVTWREQAATTEYEQRLFSLVPRRHTNRGGLEPLPRIIADQGARAALAAAVETAERVRRLSSEHVQELTQWVIPLGSALRDGVPPTSHPVREERTFPHFPGRDFAHGRGWDLPLLSLGPVAHAAGVVWLLATTEERTADWVNAGQALQRLLPTGAACGVATALRSQPLELIRTQFSNDAYPQMVLRLGTVIQTLVSARRPSASVWSAGGSHG